MISLYISLILITPAILSEPRDTSRAWLPGLSINAIWINNSSGEPTVYFEYLNQTQEVIISIENTGSIVLTDVIIKYDIVQNSVVELSGSDDSKTKLNISEVYDSKFQWTPSKGEGTIYTVYVNVTASSFSTPVGPIVSQQSFMIKNVALDVGPVNYRFDDTYALVDHKYANRTHSVIAKVKNYGNLAISTPFLVSGTIYTHSGWQELWSDSTTHSGTISANHEIEVMLPSSWTPPNPDTYWLNVSTALSNDDKPANDNISIPIEIGNVSDAGIILIEDFSSGEIYPCTPFSIQAQVTNTGNVNITQDFSALLSINSFPSGDNLFTPAPVLVPHNGPGNISNPGSSYNAIFSTWDYSNGLKPAVVWINITINPSEQNGSSQNNNYSIIIELKNWTNVELECNKPRAGLHYHGDVNNVLVNVSNTGTLDIGPYFLNLSISNQDTGELWEDYSNQTVLQTLEWSSWTEIGVLGNWEFGYNAKFKLNITLALLSSPSEILASCTRVFELAGGKVNGTFSGMVYGHQEGHGLENIIISVISRGPNQKLVNSTITLSDGSFSVDALGAPGGIEYLVTATEEDNYWWFDSGIIINLTSGRTTELNLTLYRRPAGYLNCTVELMAPVGAPQVIKDWTGTILEIEGTGQSFAVDIFGKCDIELVADVVNITVSKPNFESSRMEYVTIVPYTSNNLVFKLIESWGVKVIPSNSATDVNPSSPVVAEFDSELDTSTITPNTFTILDVDGNPIPGLTQDNYNFLKNNKLCQLIPPAQLSYITPYQIMLTSEIKTRADAPALHRTWLSNFTTSIGTGSVAGTCTYYWSRTPVAGVSVSLMNHPEFATDTDEDGVYNLEGIPKGEYILNFSFNGHLTQFRTIKIQPETMTWVNITYDDGLPVPKLWWYDEFHRKRLISDESSDLVLVDTNFTLTSNIPLDPQTINSENVRIVEIWTSEPVAFKSVLSENNNLNFEIELEEDLKYDTTYQVIYSNGLHTLDGRTIFWKETIYANFTTESIWRALSPPIIDPPNNAVNIPINEVIIIDFPIKMNRTSVEELINATFHITNFTWSNDNMTLVLEHEIFQYFTRYTVTLKAGMLSANNIYRLMNPVNSSFTTISGWIVYRFGPVIDTKGNPVENAVLALYNGSGTRLMSSITNSTGYATFYFQVPLGPGNYSMKITKAGFDELDWDFIVYSDSDFDFDPPPMIKKKGKEKSPGQNYEFVMVGIIIVVLIIISMIFLYLIKFQVKPTTEPPPGVSETPKKSSPFKSMARKFSGLFRRKRPPTESEVKAGAPQPSITSPQPKLEDSPKSFLLPDKSTSDKAVQKLKDKLELEKGANTQKPSKSDQQLPKNNF